MKITETIINTLIKRGLSGDIKNFKTTLDVPRVNLTDPPIKITITAENVQIKVEKEWYYELEN